MAARRQQARLVRLALFAVGVLGLMISVWFYASDTEPPNDADLTPAAPVLKAAVARPRAPDRLRLALESAVPLSADDSTGRQLWTWDTQRLGVAVQANAAALDNLHDLLSENDWQPYHAAWRDDDIGSQRNWAVLGAAKEAAAFYFARTGDDHAALRSALDLAALARHLQSLHAWPTFYARGTEMHMRACETLAELLRTSRATPSQLVIVQEAFARLAPSDNVLSTAMNTYYRFERGLIAGTDPTIDSSIPPLVKQHHSHLFFKPNATLRIFASGFRSLRTEVLKTPYARFPAIAALVGTEGAPLAVAGTPNVVGMKLANQRLWPYARLVELEGLERARHVIVTTMFAARRYMLDRGRLPPSLSALVPDYLAEPPLDPFNGRLLGYHSERGVIYSVGLDSVDAGGHIMPRPLEDGYEPSASLK